MSQSVTSVYSRNGRNTLTQEPSGASAAELFWKTNKQKKIRKCQFVEILNSHEKLWIWTKVFMTGISQAPAPASVHSVCWAAFRCPLFLSGIPKLHWESCRLCSGKAAGLFDALKAPGNTKSYFDSELWFQTRHLRVFWEKIFFMWALVSFEHFYFCRGSCPFSKATHSLTTRNSRVLTGLKVFYVKLCWTEQNTQALQYLSHFIQGLWRSCKTNL